MPKRWKRFIPWQERTKKWRLTRGKAEPLTPFSAVEGVEAALKILEGRWKLVILFHLFGGKVLRFSDLERPIPAISQKMLIQQLRQMEGDGIVRRIVHHQVPPKVEYCLTDWGQVLCPALDALLQWALYDPASIPAEVRPDARGPVCDCHRWGLGLRRRNGPGLRRCRRQCARRRSERGRRGRAGEELQAKGREAVALQVDVTSKAEVDRMVSTAVAAFGGLDILVNNAGTLGARGTLEDTSEAAFDAIFAVNVKGVFLGRARQFAISGRKSAA